MATTSTTDQHLDRGVAAISEYCNKNGLTIDEMFTDQCTGKNFNRPDYITLKCMAKKQGDIIIVSELDRLGRNKEDVLKELRHYKGLGVRLMILEIPTTLVDYSAMDNIVTLINLRVSTACRLSNGSLIPVGDVFDTPGRVTEAPQFIQATRE